MIMTSLSANTSTVYSADANAARCSCQGQQELTGLADSSTAAGPYAMCRWLHDVLHNHFIRQSACVSLFLFQHYRHLSFTVFVSPSLPFLMLPCHLLPGLLSVFRLRYL